MLCPISIGAFALVCLALGYVGLVLWPRWAEPAIDAPALPIEIAGTVFSVPPAAIRVPVQRHAGRQERIDLVFLWPALVPPDDDAPAADPPPPGSGRMFLTIANEPDKLAATQRLKLIYPRYVDAWPNSAPDGLTRFVFRDNSPYRGEDLFVDRTTPEHFIARCSRDGAEGTRGICLCERHLGTVDITFRFPRDWMAHWRDVATGIDRLLAQLHPPSVMRTSESGY